MVCDDIVQSQIIVHASISWGAAAPCELHLQM